MDKNQLKIILIGTVSGGFSYWAYTVSNLFTGITVFLLTGWIFFNLRSGKHIWDSLGSLKKPFMVAFLFLLIGMALSGIRSYDESKSLFFGLGIAFLAGVGSMMAHKYWSIGD